MKHSAGNRATIGPEAALPDGGAPQAAFELKATRAQDSEGSAAGDDSEGGVAGNNLPDAASPADQSGFPRNLASLRRDSGLSYAALSELTGLSQKQLYRLEHGLGGSLGSVAQVALALGVPVWHLYYQSGPLPFPDAVLTVEAALTGAWVLLGFDPAPLETVFTTLLTDEALPYFALEHFEVASLIPGRVLGFLLGLNAGIRDRRRASGFLDAEMSAALWHLALLLAAARLLDPGDPLGFLLEVLGAPPGDAGEHALARLKSRNSAVVFLLRLLQGRGM